MQPTLPLQRSLDLLWFMYIILFIDLTNMHLNLCVQSPPELDAPIKLIGKEEGKDVSWSDEGVLVHPMEMF